jgi:carbon-monoxide dehydrogenase small subunit
MLVGILLPAPQPGSTSVFLKASRVVADLAKASLAIAFTRQGERISACRVAMGSVAPTPILLPNVAETLIGQVFSQDLLAEAGSLAAETISPIDDVRSSAWYRRRIANVMLQDAMNQAWPHALEPKQASVAAPQANGHHYLPLANSLETDHLSEIELNVNGCKTKVWVAANELLLNVLREKLELTGTKYACGIGECSACTVQINGKPMLSCLVLAISAAGKEITTIEGLQDPKTGELDPLQESFIENTAFQCGYCTPGILMTAKALLNETPDPDEEQVRHYLRGNNCRCTGYASIVRAVLSCTDHQE